MNDSLWSAGEVEEDTLRQANRSDLLNPWNYTNATEVDWEKLAKERVVLAIILAFFSVATVFGNALVIIAVARERYLHTSTNYFVTSLAVADCLVGLVVMPLSATHEVFVHNWYFGTDWCDIWRSLDVLFSTASILNLCVISLDRYWAITDPFTYPTRMSRRKAAALIAGVWVCSAMISFPAIAWWRAVQVKEPPPLTCPFTENFGYLMFSSTISFYLPLFVMVFTYYRIYRAAAEQTRSLKLGTKQVLMASGELELTLRMHRGGNHTIYHHGDEGYDGENVSPPHNGLSRGPNARIPAKHISKNFSVSRKLAKFAKEKKAAKTLGIVMGVFIVCWLPFFVVNLLSGICNQCIWREELVSSIVTWLGWINSSMNPVIYACWSRDFRSPRVAKPNRQTKWGPSEHEYDTSHKSRGKVYIFNHMKFKKDISSREGTLKDVENLMVSLPKLGFLPEDIKILSDLTLCQIEESFDKISKEDHSESDMLVIFILTHGESDGKIYAHDRTYSIQEIWEHFTADKCATLKGKPKIFFIIACRGDNMDDGVVYERQCRKMSITEIDAVKCRTTVSYRIPIWADFLTIYSTAEGYYSYRNPQDGTWYIQALCLELKNYNEPEMHFMDFLTRVNRNVATTYQTCFEDARLNDKKQCPFITTSLTKVINLRLKSQEINEENKKKPRPKSSIT